MAESRRKADSRKTKPADEAAKAAVEARQTRLDRLALMLYLEGGVAIVAGMIVLSEFLSGGSVESKVWIPAAILFGILAIGVAFTWVARRKTAAQ
jgi:hypothetical protein